MRMNSSKARATVYLHAINKINSTVSVINNFVNLKSFLGTGVFKLDVHGYSMNDIQFNVTMKATQCQTSN